ncbi:hypothetical protein JCM17960_10760 [Magnetospira thiophila]
MTESTPTDSPIESASPTEPPAQKFAAPPPSAKKSSGGGGCLATLLFLVIFGGAAYYTYPSWSPEAGRLMTQYVPFLSDPLQKAQDWAALEDRVRALEAQSQNEETAPEAEAPLPLDQLEAQRNKMRDDMEIMMARIGELETALADVRGMIGAVTPPTETLGAARQDLENLVGRMNALEGTLATVGSGPGESEAAQAALQGLNARLEKLETAQADSAQLSSENAQLRDTVQQIASRLDGIESRPAAPPVVLGTAQGQALILAIEQLRTAAAGSSAFAPQLETVAGMAAGETQIVAQLNALAPFAAAGVQTVETLRIQFAEQAADIVRAGMVAADGDWMDQTLDRVLSVVKIRRTADNLAGAGADARVARAEAALASGDLIAAVDVLRGLNGGAAAAAQSWMTQAEARLTVDAALQALHGHAITLLTAKSEG